MFSTKNMYSVQNEQSIEMQNYYRWIGHYKNIVSDSLCDNIIKQTLIIQNQLTQLIKDYHQINKELKWMRYGFVMDYHFMMN